MRIQKALLIAAALVFTASSSASALPAAFLKGGFKTACSSKPPKPCSDDPCAGC